MRRVNLTHDGKFVRLTISNPEAEESITVELNSNDAELLGEAIFRMARKVAAAEQTTE